MKNRIKAAIAAAGIAALAAFCFVQTNNQTEDLFERNVEALAADELIPIDHVLCFMRVAEGYDPQLYLEVRRCSDCTLVKTSTANTPSDCML